MDRRMCDRCGVSSEVRPVTRWLPSVKGGLVFDLCSECEAGLRGMLLARIEQGMAPAVGVYLEVEPIGKIYPGGVKELSRPADEAEPEKKPEKTPEKTPEQEKQPEPEKTPEPDGAPVPLPKTAPRKSRKAGG